MKLGTKLSFGVNAIQAGQKSATVNALPQLIASSTMGKFTITAPVSKALNIAVGDNVMFLNNITGVENAIQTNAPEVVAYAQENGLDLATREGQDAILAAFTQWFIAKGVPMYDKKGNPVMVTERLTKAEKEKYLADHVMEIVEMNREALVEQYGEGSDEELASHVTTDMIEYPKYHACSGSRTANVGRATGVGVQLNFTDAAIWGALKADLEDKTSKVRTFKVDLDELTQIPYSNGKEDVTIDILPIEFEKDTDPIVRTKAESAE